MEKQPKLLFLHSYKQRCGHNYLAEILRRLCAIHTPFDNYSELPLSRLSEAAENIISNTKIERGREWIQDIYTNRLREDIIKKSLQESKNNPDYILFKYSYVTGIDSCFRIFPEDKHVILIRDPKNVVASYTKSISYLDQKSILKPVRLLAFFAGYYHWRAAKDIKQDLEMLIRFYSLNKNNKNLLLVRYEDFLTPDREQIEKLCTFLEIKYSEDKLDECKNIPVLNSSFFKEDLGSNKKWKPIQRTEQFIPNKRWQQLSLFKKIGTNSGLGKFSTYSNIPQ